MSTPLLFLIADTGGGHRASATAVARELEATRPGEYDIHIVDPTATAAPKLLQRTANLYGPIIQNASWLWGGVYYSTNSRAGVGVLRKTVLRALEPGIARLVQELQPAAVVSFHPLLNHITARVLERSAARIPLLTVITDLVDVHAAWACRDVDAIVTPSPGALDQCRRAGIPADRVFQLGLPVDPAFVAPAPTDSEREELRAKLGIQSGFVVVLCGGADGSGGIARRAKALASAGLPISLVVICGRNRRALKNVQGLKDTTGRPVLVRGFVTNMAEWIRAADVVVTKAGPGTIAEALCCGTPLLLSWYLPGQERGNVEWVVDTGAGRYVPTISGLVDTVDELTKPASSTLADMRDAVHHAATPDATARIADLIRDFATAGKPKR